MPITTVSAATTILANAMKLLDSVREQAKGSKDLTLKENINKLYGELLDLRAAQMRIEEENGTLHRRIAELEKPPAKPVIRQVGSTNYYFQGEEGPFCQPCYNVNGKLIPLAPQDRYAGGVGRKCEVCNKVFFESTEVEQIRVEPFMGGPDDWMR